MAVTEQQNSTIQRATLAAALGELQVSLLRRLAAQLSATGTPSTRWLPMQAAADQLEASVRQLRWVMRKDLTPTRG